MLISDALRAELARLLLQRDLAACARHALEAEPAADAVTFEVRFDANGMSLDVAYDRDGHPISGWGV
jgi:negative regulator of sigma E activity